MAAINEFSKKSEIPLKSQRSRADTKYTSRELWFPLALVATRLKEADPVVIPP